MKYISFFCLLVLFNSKYEAQTFSSAIEYNDYVVSQQTKIGERIIIFNEKIAVEGSTMEFVKPYYNDVVKATQDAIDKLSALGPYEKNTAFRDASLELMKFYLNCFSTDYKEMLDLLFAPEMTEENLAKISQILERVTATESGYDERYSKTQQEFARQYGFSLTENELQEKIDGE